MRKLQGSAGLVSKPLHRFTILQERFRQDLERHFLLQLEVSRQPDHSPTTAAKNSAQNVARPAHAHARGERLKQAMRMARTRSCLIIGHRFGSALCGWR